jgi:hypothetical protein
MTFHTFNPSSDTLEVGTKIRLAGREGEITFVYEDNNLGQCYKIEWNVDDENVIYLQEFDFEIVIPPAPPLTIDKRVKGEILCMMSDQGIALDKFITIEDYLNSLEET